MTSLADLLADPHALLHRIDPAAGVATFVPTAPKLLSKPSFIDGRTDFSTGPVIDVALDDLLQHDPPAPPGPNRMIFHVAFCGSTLLARLLEHEGASFVLKEPNVLVDLADWKRSGADARFAPALRLALACLRRRWSADEAMVLKPSNWPNNLLSDLAADPAGLRPMFITMEPRAYATAVLRGGRDRLAFAARTAAHLAPSVPQGNGWLQSAVAASDDPIGRVINLALVALHVQKQLFQAQNAVTIDAETIFTQPAEAARNANMILDLGLDPAQIEATVTARASVNAKRPGHAFSAGERDGENAVIEHHHGAALDAALAWACRALA